MAAVLVCQGCGGGDSNSEQPGGGTAGTAGAGTGGTAGVGGGGGTDGAGGSAGIGGTGGTGGTAGTRGVGGTGGTAGTGGVGGTGGTSAGPHAGMDLAAAATVCSSPNYQLVVTLGESPSGNTTMSSSNYRFIGGVLGATQAP